MEPASRSELHPPPLGYRGVLLKGSDEREWRVYGGVITLKKSGGDVQTREDHGREFEKVLLSSAPHGIMPPGFVQFQ